MSFVLFPWCYLGILRVSVRVPLPSKHTVDWHLCHIGVRWSAPGVRRDIVWSAGGGET